MPRSLTSLSAVKLTGKKETGLKEGEEVKHKDMEKRHRMTVTGAF